jgi:DNA repair protein RecO (recombination protein O)
MKFQKTEAIVLRKNNFSDHHKVVTLFTRNYGKVQTIARGVRKIKSKMAPHLEIGTSISCMLIEGKGLKTLSSVKSQSVYKRMRTDLSRAAELYLMCEALDKLTDEEHEHVELHDILRDSILLLEDAEDDSQAKLISSAFMVKLLKVSGYMPELHSCMVSGEAIREEDNFFSIEKGGLVKDVYKSEKNIKLSASQVKVLRFFESEMLHIIKNVKLDITLLEGIQRTLNVYVHYLLSRPIKSQHFLEKVKTLS